MPPSAPVRHSIVAAMLTAVRAITAGATYNYSVAAAFPWRTPAPEGLTYPAVCVLDLDEKVERATSPLHHRTLRVTFQAIHAAGLTQAPDEVARRLLADLEVCVQANRTWGGLAVTTNEVANRIFLDTPAEPFVVVELEVEVTYRTRLTDPASTAP